MAVGTGFGEDEYVCPAYLEESCPGCKNKGDRVQPCWVNTCDTDCGTCGGAGFSETWAVCGQAKSKFRESAWNEMGGSLRPDRYASSGNPKALPIETNWFPTVEQDRNDDVTGTWMSGLGHVPVVGTTLKTAWSGMFKSKPTPLRQKLGVDDDTMVMVNGLVFDDLLDEVWDWRHQVMDYLYDSGVNVMITPQYSAVPYQQNYLSLYNLNRVIRWYCEARDRGFEYVCFDHPGLWSKWFYDECFDFAHRSGVNLISIAYQQWGSQETGRVIADAKIAHENYPKDATFIIFGLSTYQRIVALSSVFEDRPVIYSNVNAYAGSVFFTLYPHGASAPPGVTKGQVFRYNCQLFSHLTDLGLKVAGRKVGDVTERPKLPKTDRVRAKEMATARVERMKEKQRRKIEKRREERGLGPPPRRA